MDHNAEVHRQCSLLTSTLRGTLQQIHPDGQYIAGGYDDLDLHWNPAAPARKSSGHTILQPCWFYVSHVAPRPPERVRHSYVLWKTQVSPLVVLECTAGDGGAERDQTSMTGKFWIYEQMVRARYYVIYLMEQTQPEVYQRINERYTLQAPEPSGRYVIPELDVELGVWQGFYRNIKRPWLRWWRRQGELLLTSDEQADEERQLVEQEQVRNNRVAALLRSLDDVFEQEG